jgi:dihydroorotase
MSTLLIRNGRLIDPARYLDEIRDLWIVDGTFASDNFRSPAPDETYDATGMLVMPGLVDVHVHLREPGGEAAETIATGCAAALAGGFTSIVCMPNTTPALDTPERIKEVLEKAASVVGSRVYAMATITKGRAGKELADLAALSKAGAVAFTDDGNGVRDAALLREALTLCASLGRRLAEHCEVSELSAGGAMHQGAAAEKAGLSGQPAEAESRMVARDILYGELAGAPVHLQHISSAQSVGLIRDAKQRGVNVTAEVTPHHLLLIDEDAAVGGGDFKMNPPLRGRRDREVLLKAVSEGTLEIIATDHAPHTPESKARPFAEAPFGVIGMETAAAAIWTRLVLEGVLTPLSMAMRMSFAPAKAFGLSGGTLRPGAPGDVTVFNPSIQWTVSAENFRSKSRNCPFIGMRLNGRVAATIVGGEVRYRDHLC